MAPVSSPSCILPPPCGMVAAGQGGAALESKKFLR
jgi:hypothetical protein